MTMAMRDHGGNIDWAINHFGGKPEAWIDLSTGINRCPYPVPAIAPGAWCGLPTQSSLDALHEVARTAYATRAPILATAGAQAAIQAFPRLSPPGRARVLAPTYNEHAGSLRACGWQVTDVRDLSALAGADLAVVVNPNNPDGERHDPAALLALAGRVGRLVVDESFADPYPELSLARAVGQPGLLVLRSFGKFYGLAGVRLGFVLGGDDDLATMATHQGPWAVSGPAIAIGTAALADIGWATRTRDRLARDAARLDQLAEATSWRLVGGSNLFRLYDMDDAHDAQNRLAQAQIWTRSFPWSKRWLRLGIPGKQPEWDRLASALRCRP